MSAVMNWVEEKAFKRGLVDPRFFRTVVRPAAKRRATNDAGKVDYEAVHAMAINALNQYEPAIRELAPKFHFSALGIDFGRVALPGPFGSAAGLDKNGEVLLPMTHILDSQEIGTILVDDRKGNGPTRLGVDEENETPYNAQGFPFKGLNYLLDKVRPYRAEGGLAKLFMNFCGMPSPEPNATSSDHIAHASQQYLKLVRALRPYADAFTYNCLSPNTELLKLLRTPDQFRENARTARREVGSDVPLLVKQGPMPNPRDLGVSQEEWRKMLLEVRDGTHEYGTVKGDEWFALPAAFFEGGGDGLVAINTRPTPKDRMPFESMGLSPDEWGYDKGSGMSGKGLIPYRRQALRDARFAFPTKLIVGVGGIYEASEAWDSLQFADTLQGYSGYALRGFGAKIDMAKGVEKQLHRHGYESLREYQKDLRQDWQKVDVVT